MEQRKSVLSLEEIYRAASAMREKIKAIKVSYQYTQVPTEAEKANRPTVSPPRDQRRTFAMRMPLRSAEVEGLEDGNPIHQRYVFDGKHKVFDRDNDGYPNLARMEDASGWIGAGEQFQPYAIMMDIRFAGDLFAGWPFPEVLSLPHLPYFVRDHQEKIGDRWCHVIEHPAEKFDLIWVDSENPSIMVKREMSFQHEGKLFPSTRISFGSFRDFGDGVCLPEYIERQDFPSPADNVEPGTLLSNATCEVSEIKLNDDVTQDDFTFCVRKGEKFGFFSVGLEIEDGDTPIFRAWEATDRERRIPMPFDQPANEDIKLIIAERSPAFFS